MQVTNPLANTVSPWFFSPGSPQSAAQGGFPAAMSAALSGPGQVDVRNLANLIVKLAASLHGNTASGSLAQLGALNLATANKPSVAEESAGSEDIDSLIRRAAAKHGLDPNLVRAVVATESSFNPDCVSPAGAMGLMQLMPGTAADLGVSDPFDAAQNVNGGTKYLASLLKKYEGDVDAALAAYNWGPGNVDRGGTMPAETSNYLAKVTRLRAAYAAGVDQAA